MNAAWPTHERMPSAAPRERGGSRSSATISIALPVQPAATLSASPASVPASSPVPKLPYVIQNAPTQNTGAIQ